MRREATIEPGTPLEVRWRDGVIEIEPQPLQVTLPRRGRLLVALDGTEYVALLQGVVSQGIAGGRTYDAVIAACARKARVGELLTLNRRPFDSLSGGIAVVDPVG